MDGESARSAFQAVEPDHETAKKIAARVWDATQYRYIYKKKAESRSSTAATTYTFFCAQNEKEVTKTRLTDDLRKRRARMKMDRFACNGYLHVTVNPDIPETIRLRVQHHRAHCHYVDISLPDDIKNLVEKMKDQPASNIWSQVLQDYPQTQVTQKQIYALW
ncbi:hypothetical protein GGX14DRAFT_372334, partial [Mycena pura]